MPVLAFKRAVDRSVDLVANDQLLSPGLVLGRLHQPLHRLLEGRDHGLRRLPHLRNQLIVLVLRTAAKVGEAGRGLCVFHGLVVRDHRRDGPIPDARRAW